MIKFIFACKDLFYVTKTTEGHQSLMPFCNMWDYILLLLNVLVVSAALERTLLCTWLRTCLCRSGHIL